MAKDCTRAPGVRGDFLAKLGRCVQDAICRPGAVDEQGREILFVHADMVSAGREPG